MLYSIFPHIKKHKILMDFLKQKFISPYKINNQEIRCSRTWGNLIIHILSIVSLYHFSSWLPPLRSVHGPRWLYSIQKEIGGGGKKREGTKDQKPSFHRSQPSLNRFYWRLKDFYSTFPFINLCPGCKVNLVPKVGWNVLSLNWVLCSPG